MNERTPYRPFHEGVAIVWGLTRDDSRLVKAVANTYVRLTVGYLPSIVREFWTCQWVGVPSIHMRSLSRLRGNKKLLISQFNKALGALAPSALLKGEIRNFFGSLVTGRGCACGCWWLGDKIRPQTSTPNFAANISSKVRVYYLK